MSMNTIDPSQWTTSTNPNTTDVLVGGADYLVQNADKSYSFTSPSANTLQFEVRPGDVWSAVDPSTKERSEIAGTTTYAQGTQVDVSYGWTVEPGQTNDAQWLVAGQFHQTANNGMSPPFQIDLRGDKMAIVIDETGNGAESYNNFKTIYSDTSNIVRGHTYQMQIEAKFDPVNGFLEVIRDGVTLVDYHGPLGSSTMGSVYWKEGVYRSAETTSGGKSDTTIAIDYSNLKVGTGATTTTTSTGTSTSTSTGTSTGAKTTTGTTSTTTTTPSTGATSTTHTTKPAPQVTPNHFTHSGSSWVVGGWGNEIGSKVVFHDGSTWSASSTLDGQAHWKVSLKAYNAVHSYTYQVSDGGVTSPTHHLILGTEHADTLTAQSAGDFLWGAGGGDTFVLGTGTADQTTIGWFEQGKDHVEFKGFTAGHTTVSQVDSTHWHVTDGVHSATFIVANGVHLTSSDWIFG